MNKKMIKNIIIISVFFFAICILTSSSKAAYISVKPNTTSATPGQNVTLTISSDCIGRVNLSVSNGTLSTNKVFIDGAQTATVTVGNSGTTTITATPSDMSTADGVTANVSASSTSITIKSTSNSSSTSGKENNKDTNTNSNTSTKSSNANLSNLGIKPNDFTGFKSGTTKYEVTVPADVKEIEVYATAQHNKSKISGTGKKTLDEGVNNFEVIITAEDGTKKTYTIQVTRETAQKEETEETDTKKGLAELEIENLSLTPSFQTDVYEYQIKYIGQDTKLNLTTKATQEDYIIDITGNEDLKQGENIITILVSDKEGNNVATYQLIVNKSLVDEEAIAREEKQKQEELKNKIIIGTIVAIIIIAIVIIMIIKHKRNRRFEEEEYFGIPYSGINEKEDKNQWEENEKEELSKEELKNKYFENYNNTEDTEEFYEKERLKKTKHKGKRFK